MLATTPDGLSNDRGRVLGPHEGRGMTVPLRDVRVDVTHECADGLERRTANGLAREDTEPRLAHVLRGTVAGDATAGDLEGGVQAGQPVPAIVMRLPRRQAGAQRQQRLRA